MPPLVPCPQCEQHAKRVETHCPHCGAAMQDAGGRLRRTATAAVLGLAAATSCDAFEPVDEYGPPPTHDHAAEASAKAKAEASAAAKASASAKAAASAKATGSAAASAAASTAPSASAAAKPEPSTAVPEYGPPPTR